MLLRLIRPFAVCALVAGPLLDPVALQAGTCNQLEQDACAAEASCRWVNGYQRTDGKEVRGYCRSLPKEAGQQPPQKPVSGSS